MPSKVENIAIEGIMSPVVFAAPTAIKKRDELLKAAKVVLIVNDVGSAEQAVDMLRQLKEFTDAIELSRKEVKGPIDDVVKSIQDTARDLTLTITAERGRLDRMVGDYNAKQQEIANRERQRLLDEQQKLIDAANKNLADAIAAGASDKKLDKIEAKAFEQIAVAKAETASIAAPSFAGVSVRRPWEYEVTDYAALYAAHPECVKMTAVDAVVKALLNQGKTLPGVTARQVNRAIVR